MNIFKTAMVAALTVSGFAMAPAAYAQMGMPSAGDAARHVEGAAANEAKHRAEAAVQDRMTHHDAAPAAAEHGMGDMHHGDMHRGDMHRGDMGNMHHDRGMRHGRHNARRCFVRHHHRVCR